MTDQVGLVAGIARPSFISLLGSVAALALFIYSFRNTGEVAPFSLPSGRTGDGSAGAAAEHGAPGDWRGRLPPPGEADSEERTRIDCSSWRTYGQDVGGRAVMKYDDRTPAKKKDRKAAAKCRTDGTCYPMKVTVEGVEGDVPPGVHNFTIRSKFARDEFHVALEGPELSPTFVEAHGNGEYTASYCVELPGFYQLHVRILQIDGHESLRRDVFRSPFAVRVRGRGTRAGGGPSPAGRPDAARCRTARRASQGRWVRYDHAARHGLLPRDERPRWEEVLEATADEYVWLPYACRLQPLNLAGLRGRFENRTHCLCCDSYLRSLFADALFVFGMIDETKHFEKRSKTPDVHRSWELEGVSMAWHDRTYFSKCLAKSPNGISIVNILDQGLAVGEGTALAKVAAATARGGGRFVFFVGHPWSGDHRIAHRRNADIQRAQRSAYDDLPPGVDVFDAVGFAFPRIYHEVCDSSHVSCVVSGRLTVLAYWELLILAQLLPEQYE